MRIEEKGGMILNIGNARQSVIVIHRKKVWGTLYDTGTNLDWTIANVCVIILGDVLNECSPEPESQDVHPNPPAPRRHASYEPVPTELRQHGRHIVRPLVYLFNPHDVYDSI